jgi:hypothetical protein
MKNQGGEKMYPDDRIQREIRRRAFDRKDLLEQQTTAAQFTQYTIDALEQVTGLPRIELERIASEVSTSFRADEDDFFGIKDQLIIAGSAFIPVLMFFWLMMLWIL